MMGCQHGDAIDRSYIVFLHRSSSLEKHTRTIWKQANLDLVFKHIFPETTHHGIYYAADNVDDLALDAIRADLAVDFVECNRLVDLTPFWDVEDANNV